MLASGCRPGRHRGNRSFELSDEEIDNRLAEILPESLEVAKWNRELVQKGMSEMGRESLEQTKRKMGIADREDLISFADMIEFDEERIPLKPSESQLSNER